MGFLGGGPNGVISHADLSANFNGMRFWSHVLAVTPDPLGPEYQLGPYVVCDQGKFVRVADVNWLNYVDESFDEALNCSSYRTEKFAKKVGARIQELEQKLGYSLACDEFNSRISNLRETKYRAVAKWLYPKRAFSRGSRDFQEALP